jgi:hypothetical protein
MMLKASNFQKEIQKRFEKLIINSPFKSHLNYYSSGALFKKKFKEFKFTNFKKTLNAVFKV